MNKRSDVRIRTREIESLYSSGKSAKEISSIFLCSRSTIVDVLREVGVKIRRQGGFPSQRKYKDNENFFKFPNQISSYWAGFIAADGCVVGNKLKIYLSNKDRKHLMRFRDSVSPDRPIYNIKSRSYFSESFGKPVNGKEQCGIEICSAEIILDLQQNFGIHRNKSLTLSPPALSYENSIAFIVGYIDGDGSIGTSRSGDLFFDVVGTESVVGFIRGYLVGLNPKLRISISKTGNVFKIGTSCGKIKSALRLMFETVDVPFMERKWKHVLA